MRWVGGDYANLTWADAGLLRGAIGEVRERFNEPANAEFDRVDAVLAVLQAHGDSLRPHDTVALVVPLTPRSLEAAQVPLRGDIDHAQQEVS